jgi:hypothetical protein
MIIVPLTHQVTLGRGKPLTLTMNLAGSPSATSTGSGFMSIDGGYFILGSSKSFSSRWAGLFNTKHSFNTAITLFAKQLRFHKSYTSHEQFVYISRTEQRFEKIMSH